MINIYKKIEKSNNNPNGIVEIENISSLNKPFLLCLSAQNNHDKSIYGIMRGGASISRVYTTQEEGARYKINDFPIDFLGLRYQKDNKGLENYEEIVDDFLYPFLTSESKNVNEILMQARKINFMTYCDGTETYCKVENRLVSKFKSDGFSSEDIESIISQISLTAIGTMIDTSSLMATSISFVDVNDNEISTDRTDNYKESIQSRNRKGIYGTLGRNNNIIYIYNGNGVHDLKEYFKDDTIVKPVIAGAMAYFLEMSLSNSNLEVNELLSKLNMYTDETKKSSELLSMLDNSLNYGTSKYNEAEIGLRKELDVTCKRLYDIEKNNIRLQRENNNFRQTINSVVSNVRDNCTENTSYMILVPSGLWQAPNDEYKNSLSDRELLEGNHRTK